MKISAADFDLLCTSLRDSISSLKSCHDREVPNEARILRGVIMELRSSVLRRSNPRLLERRENLLKAATETLVERERP